MTDEKEGTFLVTHAAEDSAVLKDVEGGQVLTLSSNPGLKADEIVECTVAPDPPMNVTFQVVEFEERRQICIEQSDEPPTTQEQDIASDQSVGEVTKEPRAGEGEIHVITVPEDTTEAAVTDVVEDRETTLSRAARLGVERVEVRAAPGVVSVRYMP